MIEMNKFILLGAVFWTGLGAFLYGVHESKDKVYSVCLHQLMLIGNTTVIDRTRICENISNAKGL